MTITSGITNVVIPSATMAIPSAISKMANMQPWWQKHLPSKYLSGSNPVGITSVTTNKTLAIPSATIVTIIPTSWHNYGKQMWQ